MFNISSFLGKFSKNIYSLGANKKYISEVIEKHLEFKISPEDVEVRNYTVFLEISPTLKNKIFISKNKILEEINSNLTPKIVDIK